MSESTLERESFPEGDGPEVTVGATGQELREHREALGASLSDVSDTLRIRGEFLESLESGHYDALPGEAYAVGFVRSYAKYLGLDAEAMVRRFKVELTGERPTARLDFLKPAAESRVPTAAIVFVAVLLAVAIYGLWYFLNARDVSVADMVPEIPARLAGMGASTSSPAPGAKAQPGAAMPTAPGGQAEPAKQSGGATPPASGDAPSGGGKPAAAGTPETAPTKRAGAVPGTAGKPAPPVAAQPAAPESPGVTNVPAPQSEAAGPEAAAPEVSPKPAFSSPMPPSRRPAPAPEAAAGTQQVASAEVANAPAPAAGPAAPAADSLAPARIVLRAKADSWVEIRSGGGDLVISRVLSQGTTYAVPPKPGLTLTTGNAGGLEILVDGEALPALGGDGKVRRDIALDPDSLKRRIAGRSR